MERKIRVGLLIDDVGMTAWEYLMLERIIASGATEIVLVVKRKHSPVLPRTFTEKLKENMQHGLFKVFAKVESRLFTAEKNAFEIKDTTPLIGNIPLIEVECLEKKFSDYLFEEDIAKIRQYKVDVFLRLGFRILRGDILKAARLGVWSYHHGDNRVYRGGPAGYWEVLRKENQVGSVLQVLTEDLDGGEVLYRSWSSTEPSPTRTISSMFWKTALFIPRKLEELHRLGEEAFLQKMKAENTGFEFYSGRNYTMPRNREMWGMAFSWVWERFSHKCWKLFNFEQWVLLYAYSTKGKPGTAAYRFKTILPPHDRYWADPCVVKEDEKHYVFFEEVIYQEHERGHIAVVEINSKGVQSSPVRVLERPYHLSYPFVFRYKGSYFMIPESEENNAIELYECTAFPYTWTFRMNLMTGIKAVDTTLLFREDKIWMFTNIRETEGSSYSEELFIFSAEELFTTDWIPHSANPVVSDARSSRPAGAVFMYNDILYRPSQDCSKRYGYATRINEILTLNQEEYQEKEVSSITPDWGNNILATHTYSFEGNLTAIDAVIKRRKGFRKFFGLK